ncbi:RNA binding protein, heterogenous nuclear RNP-K like protein [Entomophthora muscae]|uniref:RNA binding protein, heterogenous nuclear RNP-K like protein n=2 Tax=Entomophthora muscae TaxID=34485 RepID=A0ACC2TR45_9FUNG|nr:RNA binding protein, heterogenous nuclear RNP-K like protein [Entomophthora muscae]KAJ9080968.1 RNA binding protein, heterogenous nuclear RNP-K like protein [Entomophthora muscae]
MDPSSTASASPVSTPQDDFLETPWNFHPFEECEDTGYVTIMRGLMTNREAGVVIGKNGANMDELRRSSGARIAISKPETTCSDRVVTVGGERNQVAVAYGLMSRCLSLNELTNRISFSGGVRRLTPSHTFVRILIAHSLMGTIIGKHGAAIRHVETATGSRVIALKAILPRSTERVVEVQGSIIAITSALRHIALCMRKEWVRALGVSYYLPIDSSILSDVILPRDQSHPFPGINDTMAQAVTVPQPLLAILLRAISNAFPEITSQSDLLLTVHPKGPGTSAIEIEGDHAIATKLHFFIRCQLKALT